MATSGFLFLCTLLTFLPLALGAQKAGSEDKARRPLLGVVHTQAPRGVRIEKILPDSAAERAGLKVGDTILSVNSVPIRDPKHLFSEVQRYSAGSVVAIEYERAGKTQVVQVALGERLDAAALVGKKAPRISLPQMGKEHPFTPTAGKVVIIDFWATWCGPCEPVRRALEDFQRQRGKSDIEIAGISSEDAETVKAFYHKRRAAYPILLDDKSAVTLSYRVAGYPTIVVIDKNGIVRFAGFASGGGLEQALELAKKLAAE